MVDRKIENLIEGDTFVHDGEFYFVLENTSISTSFNELKVASEEGNHNLRLRKTCMVTLSEKKTPKLNKPFRTSGGPKKFSVHVRNAKGNIVKVNFGDPNMEIKRDDPERRKNFRARHNCADKTDKTKAGRGNQIKRGRKKKKKVDESFNRLNTVRNSIRRDLNEEI